MKLNKGILVVASALSVAVAQASSLGDANGYNAFIFNDANLAGGHSQGAVAVGHDLQDVYEIDQNSIYPTVSGLTNVGLVVGDKITSVGTNKIWGNAYVAGTIASPLLHNSGADFASSSLVHSSYFSNQKAYSLSQADAIHTLAQGSNGNVINPGSEQNNLNIDVSAAKGQSYDSTVKVFSIDGSLLTNSNYQNLKLNFTNVGSNTVLVDVTGSTVDFKWKLGSNDLSRIVYSFDQATSLTVGSNDSFEGSILAPKASVTQLKNIEGSLIANNWTTVGAPELHLNGFQFTGNAPVPEPSAFALGGFAVFGGFLAQRKRASRRRAKAQTK